MTSLKEIQKNFFQKLQENNSNIKCENDHFMPIYVNNYKSNLKSAIQNNFPLTRDVLGEEFFDFMAVQFVIKHPPKQASLNCYGEEFSMFLSSQDKLNHLNYLEDLVNFEYAMLKCYYAETFTSSQKELLKNKIANVPIEDQLKVKLKIHPQIFLMKSDFDLISLKNFIDNSSEGKININDPSYIIIKKDENQESQASLIGKEEFEILEKISQSENIDNLIDMFSQESIMKILSMQIFSEIYF